MNKVVLMGRLTRDPEIKYTSANNTAVCTFSLAVNRRFSKQGEERQADFINITTWSKTAEFCNNYFTKGQQVAVIGRLQTRSWEDEQGKRRYATDVVAEEAYFADSKKGQGNGGQPSGGQAPSGYTKQPPAPRESFTAVNDDDDLPF